jgi:hypothetical protein
MGCFKDHFGRDLRAYLGSAWSIEECRAEAASKNFDYIGL